MSEQWPPPQPNQPYGNQPYGGQPYGQQPPPHPQQPSQQQPPQPPQQGWGQAGWGQQPGPQDPYRPMGQQPLQRVDIDSYAAPKSSLPIVLTVLAVLAVAAIVLGGLFLRPAPAPAPTPTPTATETAAGPGLPFTMPSNANAGGRWEILDEKWDSEGVALRVRVYADKGTVSYAFLAFANSGQDVIDPQPSQDEPQLTSGVLREGKSATGYVYFPMPRGTGTLVLTTSGGRQMSALPIRG